MAEGKNTRLMRARNMAKRIAADLLAAAVIAVIVAGVVKAGDAFSQVCSREATVEEGGRRRYEQ